MHRIIVAAAALLIAGCTQPPDPTGAAAVSPTSTSGAATFSPAPVTASPPAPRTEVPDLIGLNLERAEKVAARAHLQITYEEKLSHEKAGSIIKQAPKPGARVAEDSTIVLAVAKPFPVIPDVIGMRVEQATRVLKKAGFRTKVIRSGTSGTPGTVTAQRPPAGEEVRPGIVVAVTVPNCTPGYSPCLPPASDYDCAGGSGDGPKYVYGTVRVTGYDPYGLDADNDGYGCE